jgi:hypothetical protein
MKTLLQIEMYYVREYTPPVRVELIIFKNLQLECILHYLINIIINSFQSDWCKAKNFTIYPICTTKVDTRSSDKRRVIN